MSTLPSYNHVRAVAQVTIEREKELVRQAFAQARGILDASQEATPPVHLLTEAETVAKVQEALVDTGLVKRCLKTKKDPNAPKGSKSAYMFWCNDNRAAIKAKHPTYKMTEVAKELGVAWKKVKAKDKVPYQKLADADKKRATEEKATYKPATGEGTIPLSSYNYLRKSAQVTLDREKDLVSQALAMAQVLVSADGNTDTDTLVDPETVNKAQASLIDMGVVKRCLKSKKDPNAPKGIRSAYMLWCEANRTAVQEQHPTFKMTDIAKELGNLWKTVEDEVKAEFQEKSAADKERYAQEKEAYEQQLALATGGLTGAGATNAEASA